MLAGRFEGIVHFLHKLSQQITVISAISSGVLNVYVESISITLLYFLELVVDPGLSLCLISQLSDRIVPTEDDPHLDKGGNKSHYAPLLSK